MTTFSLSAQHDASDTSVPELSLISVKSHRRIELAATRAGGQETSVDIADQDVVVLELDGGFKLYLRGDRLRAEAGRPPSRSGDDWQLAAGLALEDNERALGRWAIKALEVFGLDVVEEPVLAIARKIEPSAEHGQLLRHDATAEGGWRIAEQMETAAAEAPSLLLIHGTFSSTHGSFGDLFVDRDLAQRMVGHYGGRVYGFEHHTITRDPLQNVQDLLPKLANGARLHLLSHSRGGLVGDLLALLAPAGADAAAVDAEALTAVLRPSDGRADLAQALTTIARELKQRDIRVERFVRVASPSRGTTLASGRLDRWLSILANLADLTAVAGPVSPLVGGVIDLTVAVTHMATEPEELPGLAAMGPDSRYVRLLNHARREVACDLSVVAGDVQASGLWSRVKLLIPDLFYAGDHDLVVNTGSMYGGPAYGSRRYLFDQGPEVNHFRYFSNPSTAPLLVEALIAEAPAPGFVDFEGDKPAEIARAHPDELARRPVLFVLPGILGSTLEVDGEPVWLDAMAVLLGRLADLDLDSRKRPTVTAGTPIARAYGDLLNYFSNTYDLVPFAYDWRLSVADAAKRLADEVEKKLDQAERHHQPVRLLAHSMGGLVARAMIAARPDLWQRIRNHPDGRLVMCGTPNGGSWEMVRLLTARAMTVKLLAAADQRHEVPDLLRFIAELPGVLELLPDDGDGILDHATWQRLHQQDDARRARWHQPGRKDAVDAVETRLEQAAAVRRMLREQALGPDGMLYVAGQSAETAAGVDVVDQRVLFFPTGNRTLEFQSSRRGDGAVLWDDGPLPRMQTWYMEGVEHGDLLNQRSHFPAIQELLTRGGTDALPRSEPVTRGADVIRPMREHEPEYLPDEAAILAAALVMGPQRPRPQMPAPTRVRVVHGNLAFARFPVMVGHYSGDTIIAAEAYLDRALGGRLSAKLELGIYPGALNTHAWLPHPYPDGRPQGALVLGLGEVGELTPSKLTETTATALLNLARALAERPLAGRDDRQHAGAEALEIRLSPLLIGTGAGGIEVGESVRALLRGIARANVALAGSSHSKRLRIAEVELIEIREDMAIQAARALRDLATDPELREALRCEQIVRVGKGGQGVGIDDTDPDWWHRLQIVDDEQGGLVYTFLTRRARATESLVATQRVLVDAFVADAVGTTSRSPKTSRTLFEMLLPHRLKDGGELRTNMVLVVDEASARYPWEMLEDRWSADVKPPAVERGLLRQLRLREGRVRPDPGLRERGRALVIGEPSSHLPPLPGARAEAEKVRASLAMRDLGVTSLIGANAMDIVQALHADAYQVLHLAGHGVHAYQPGDDEAIDGGKPKPKECKPLSGMVIGRGPCGPQVLTAADVKQMRQVPELVFINCCHLGRTDTGATDDPLRTDRNRLAANLAVAFIEMGVRAVIAAGWAVDDSAALCFCETFYGRMREGKPFGEAVRLAREQTWQTHRHSNTWGAYQCYGDPDFRLIQDASGHASEPEPECFVAPSEAITELRNLRARAQVAARDDIGTLRDALERIDRRLEQTHRACEADWRHGDPDVLAARGLACFDLGLYPEAERDLGCAIKLLGALRSRDLVEHRARCQSRIAAAMFAAAKDEREKEAARQRFDDAIAAIEEPPGAAHGIDRIERVYSLSGLYWRKLPALAAGPERKALLEVIVALYAQADDDASQAQHGPDDAASCKHEPKTLNAYNRLLWLTASYLLSGYSQATIDELEPAFERRCEQIKATASEDAEPGITDELTSIEVDLLRTIRDREVLEQQDGMLRQRIETIAQRLSRLIERGLSNRQWSGLWDNLVQLEVLLSEATVSPKQRRADAAIVADVRRRLPQR